MKYKTDIKMVKRAMQGDEQAMNKLIETKFDDILYFVIKNTNFQDAEDIAQQSVLHIYKDIRNLRDPEKFHSWMISLVYHDCMDFLRKKRSGEAMMTDDTYIVDEMEEENIEFLPEKYVEDAEGRKLVMEIINSLPHNYQESLLLFYFENMKYEEIAEILGVSWVKVRNDLFRAKAQVKARLERHTGRTLLLSASPAGALSAFTRLYRTEQGTLVTPEFSKKVWDNVMDGLPWQNVNAAPVKSTSPKQVQASPHNISAAAVKAVAAGTTATLIVAGVLIASGRDQPVAGNAEILPAIVNEAAWEVMETAPEASLEIEPQVIRTLEDMIGVEEAALLYEYQSSGVAEAEWLEFLERIQAEVDMEATEHQHDYKTYLLEKQNKQLILAEEREHTGGNLRVQFEFRDKGEIPYMYEVVLWFR